MEFKEAIKTRKRMCDYYKNCNCCPIEKFEDGCMITLEGAEELDEYERILEEWAKEHPVTTNADKFVEIIENTFGISCNKEGLIKRCPMDTFTIKKPGVPKHCIEIGCLECKKWWDEEYKEPEKEGKANEQI